MSHCKRQQLRCVVKLIIKTETRRSINYLRLILFDFISKMHGALVTLLVRFFIFISFFLLFFKFFNARILIWNKKLKPFNRVLLSCRTRGVRQKGSAHAKFCRTYSCDKLIPCRRTKTIRLIIGKHLKHAVSRDGCSASNIKYTDTLLKNGTSFGPTLFNWNRQNMKSESNDRPWTWLTPP